MSQFAAPRNSLHTSNDLGIFAQDQWTIDKLTLNLGVRYDHVNAYIPDQSHPGPYAEEFFGADAVRFVPGFDVARIENVPNYHDIVPRLGAAYDLFGDGRTAIKATLGKYVLPVATSIAELVNPMNAIVTFTRRTWGDLPFQGGNGNFVPDCDFDNFAANGECGAIEDPQFGLPAITQVVDPDLLDGWGKREYQWQTSVSVQQELFTGWSVEVGYFRTWYKNHRVVDNLNITPDNFDEYSITAPVDPRLGSFSGATLDGLYTIDAAGQAAGRMDFITLAENIPGGDVMGQWYNGVDVNFAGRLTDLGINLGGGVSLGQTRFNECFVIDNPTQARPGFCEVANPWGAGTQFKLNGSVPLPYDTEVSFVFQNLPGLPWQGIYQAGADLTERALIEQQLGRPLLVASENVPLFPGGNGLDLNGASGGRGGISPDTFNVINSDFYEKRLTQLDLRFTKILPVGQGRVRVWFDIFNIFNAVNATTLVNNYTAPGLPFPGVGSVMGGRLLKFGGQIDF